MRGPMDWLIFGGSVFSGGSLKPQDILIRDGKVELVEAGLQERLAEEKLQHFDASGCLVSPGFVDLHVHLRQPGQESKETIKTGTLAAARGGFTTVCAMPNTIPALDCPATIESFNSLVQTDAYVRVHPVAALSIERAGVELVDMEQLVRMGVKLFSDDGDPAPAPLIKQALQMASRLGAVVINHLEERSESQGQFHPQISSASEYEMLRRDLEVVLSRGGHYHVPHVSCHESVAFIAAAKKDGLQVTAEVTPHHLTLTADQIGEPRGHYQMKPPLRDEKDRQGLLEGLRQGVIDAIATDHAPHGREKERFAAHSPFGVTGLETAFPVLYTDLVLTEVLPLETVLHSLTDKPAGILGTVAEIKPGASADLTIIDVDKKMTVRSEQFFSKGTNSPYIGRELTGWPLFTLVGGRIGFRCSSAKWRIQGLG